MVYHITNLTRYPGEVFLVLVKSELVKAGASGSIVQVLQFFFLTDNDCSGLNIN